MKKRNARKYMECMKSSSVTLESTLKHLLSMKEDQKKVFLTEYLPKLKEMKLTYFIGELSQYKGYSGIAIFMLNYFLINIKKDGIILSKTELKLVQKSIENHRKNVEKMDEKI